MFFNLLIHHNEFSNGDAFVLYAPFHVSEPNVAKKMTLPLLFVCFFFVLIFVILFLFHRKQLQFTQ